MAPVKINAFRRFTSLVYPKFDIMGGCGHF